MLFIPKNNKYQSISLACSIAGVASPGLSSFRSLVLDQWPEERFCARWTNDPLQGCFRTLGNVLRYVISTSKFGPSIDMAYPLPHKFTYWTNCIGNFSFLTGNLIHKIINQRKTTPTSLISFHRLLYNVELPNPTLKLAVYRELDPLRTSSN